MSPLLLLSLLLLTTVQAQQASQPVTGKRVALVIGSNHYASSPLQNCAGDATAIVRMLREPLKFDVVLADKDEMATCGFRCVLAISSS